MPSTPNLDWRQTNTVSGPLPAPPEGSQTLAKEPEAPRSIAHLSGHQQPPQVAKLLVVGHRGGRGIRKIRGRAGPQRAIGQLHQGHADAGLGTSAPSGWRRIWYPLSSPLQDRPRGRRKTAAPTSSHPVRRARRVFAAGYPAKQIRIPLARAGGSSDRHMTATWSSMAGRNPANGNAHGVISWLQMIGEKRAVLIGK